MLPGFAKVKKIISDKISTGFQIEKTFPVPDIKGSYLSDLIIKGNETEKFCRVDAIVTDYLGYHYARYERVCLGTFSNKIIKGITDIDRALVISAKKDDLLAYIVKTTGFLPVWPSYANPLGSLAAGLNRQKFEDLQKLIPQEPHSQELPVTAKCVESGCMQPECPKPECLLKASHKNDLS